MTTNINVQDFLLKAEKVNKIDEGTYAKIYIYKYNNQEYIVKDFHKLNKTYKTDIIKSWIYEEVDALVKFQDLDCIPKLFGVSFSGSYTMKKPSSLFPNKSHVKNNRMIIIMEKRGNSLARYINTEEHFDRRLASAMEMLQKISPFIVLSKKIHFNHYDIGLNNILIDDTNINSQNTKQNTKQDTIIDREGGIITEQGDVPVSNNDSINNDESDIDNLQEYDYSIIDFGISDFSLGYFGKVKPGAVYTMYWRPPEFFSRNAIYINMNRDKGDIWCYGLTVLELLAGKRFIPLDVKREVDVVTKLINYARKDSPNSHNNSSEINNELSIDLSSQNLSTSITSSHLKEDLYEKLEILIELTHNRIVLDYSRFLLENISETEYRLIPDEIKQFLNLSLQYNPRLRMTTEQFIDTLDINVDNVKFQSYIIPSTQRRRLINENMFNIIWNIVKLFKMPISIFIISLEVTGRYFGMFVDDSSSNNSNDSDNSSSNSNSNNSNNNSLINKSEGEIEFDTIAAIWLVCLYCKLYTTSYYYSENYLLATDKLYPVINLDYIKLRERSNIISSFNKELNNRADDIANKLQYYILNWELLSILSEYDNDVYISEVESQFVNVSELIKQFNMSTSEWTLFKRRGDNDQSEEKKRAEHMKRRIERDKLFRDNAISIDFSEDIIETKNFEDELESTAEEEWRKEKEKIKEKFKRNNIMSNISPNINLRSSQPTEDDFPLLSESVGVKRENEDAMNEEIFLPHINQVYPIEQDKNEYSDEKLPLHFTDIMEIERQLYEEDELPLLRKDDIVPVTNDDDNMLEIERQLYEEDELPLSRKDSIIPVTNDDNMLEIERQLYEEDKLHLLRKDDIHPITSNDDNIMEIEKDELNLTDTMEIEKDISQQKDTPQQNNQFEFYQNFIQGKQTNQQTTEKQYQCSTCMTYNIPPLISSIPSSLPYSI